MSDNNERENNNNNENILKWSLRYVIIPISLAVIAGLFALEVIDREIESRNTSGNAQATSFAANFATQTAIAATPIQPPQTNTETPEASSMPEATSTVEIINENTPLPPTVSQPGSPVCIQVPIGWQLYTVKWGDTLYSLARRTETTIETIRQVNCLFGVLKANQQIWLPAAYSFETALPVPTSTPTSIIIQTATSMPTPTLTSTPGLPDLTNNTGNLPTASVSCPQGPGSCVTRVDLAVTNNGTGDAGIFNIQVLLDPDQSVVVNQPVNGLISGDTQVITITGSPGGNCYDPDCTVCIVVDSNYVVTELDEGNNQFCRTFPG